MFDVLDVNNKRLGNIVPKHNEKLLKLLDAIGDLPLNKKFGFPGNNTGLFGDAYEYLMTMYTFTESKTYQVEHYNLDLIISNGYEVKFSWASTSASEPPNVYAII